MIILVASKHQQSIDDYTASILKILKTLIKEQS